LSFDGYNKKFDIPEKIELTDEEHGKIEEFKHRVIYKEVYQANEDRGVFDEWMQERVGGLAYARRCRDERAAKKAKELGTQVEAQPQVEVDVEVKPEVEVQVEVKPEVTEEIIAEN
jgi:hypothetical protein